MRQHEDIMRQWDKWRTAIAGGERGSWPRDEFEALMDEKCAEIKRLNDLRHYNAEALWKQNDQLMSEIELLRDQVAKLQAIIDKQLY